MLKPLTFNQILNIQGTFEGGTLFYYVGANVQQLFNSQISKDLIANLLTFIFKLFHNSIPYITEDYYYTSLVPEEAITRLGDQIVAYIGLYAPTVYAWCVNYQQLSQSWNFINQGLTHKYNVQSHSNNQNAGYSKTSFNPLSEEGPTPYINVAPVNPAQLNLNEENQIQVQNFSFNNNATFNVDSNANNSNNIGEGSTFSLQNIQALQLRYTNLLRPLIYKLSTLFWILGDNQPDNGIIGDFDIW